MSINCLDGLILNDYKNSIKFYKSERARETLDNLKVIEGKLAGSSPFIQIHLINSGLIKSGTGLPRLEDLEKVIGLDNTFLTSSSTDSGLSYTDFGLVLRSRRDYSHPKNNLLAKRLYDQLENRGIKFGLGKLIYLSALELKEEENSAYGLVFDLKEDLQDYILDLHNFGWNYSRNEGLSIACIGRKWKSCIGEILDRSNGNGRIFTVDRI